MSVFCFCIDDASRSYRHWFIMLTCTMFVSLTKITPVSSETVIATRQTGPRVAIASVCLSTTLGVADFRTVCSISVPRAIVSKRTKCYSSYDCFTIVISNVTEMHHIYVLNRYIMYLNYIDRKQDVLG